MYTEYKLVPNLDSIICDVLKEKYDVKSYEKGHYWFTPWENHRRMVFNLYPLKGSSYPIYWGYNFDFIPWEKCFLGINPKPWNESGKLVYHRTEKSINIDFRGDIFSFIEYNFSNPSLHSSEEHKAFRNKYFVQAYGSDSLEDIEKIKNVVRRNIPFIIDWFDRIKTIDDIIVELSKDIIDCENKRCFPFSAYWVRGFLKAKVHDIEGALSDIAYVYNKFNPPTEIPEKVIKNIYEIDKL
ncbi:MAG: hypothetical protein J5997_05025 [Oscillospiraceae bacterium]|nr:hypothetical protein [Oscillospiraceae bacterium]